MTVSAALALRPFEPGTTGWTADDLDDPDVARLWERGAYEVIEGVLTKTPPAYHDGTLPLNRLRRLVERHLDRNNLPGEFSTEDDDVVLAPKRVVRVDMVFMTPDDHTRQQAANAVHGRRDLKFGRIQVPPTLVIESVSPGHEAHDLETKRDWYARAGIPNYWIVDGYKRTLECLVLDRDHYRVNQTGRGADEVRPSLFPGLVLPLASIWA